MIKDYEPSQIDIPGELLQQWQNIVNTMAELACIPAGLIMRIAGEEIEVFISSQTEGNPYKTGDHEQWENSGLYCETVIKTKNSLLIPDALSDPDWKDNPDVKLNMISYLGFPILYPDDTPFGTICILDNKSNPYNEKICSLLDNFRQLIEQHLSLLYFNMVLGEKNRSLMDYLGELKTLRGLVPICARCKRIKNSEGHWHPVEKYLVRNPEVDLSHGYCPDCAKNVQDEIKHMYT